jgi:DNA (cytosine-5)-methyltransferase 1
VDNTITTLEFCAGYGGIGLGLKNIFGERLRCLAYCELEGFAQANLISKMEKGLLDVAPLWSDLKTFPYGKFHGLVDILIAGYPCQPFSAAGKRAGKDDPRHLWPWIADGIRVLRPRTCFLENVEGHISLGLSTVVSDLEELGYKVSWGIFSASECGAPHQRKRVFILAHRIGEGLERFLPSARIDQEGWEIPGGSAARCGELRGDWERVVFAA